MEKLTKRQQIIFDFIKQEIKTKGIPPSIREIGEVAGLSSTSSVHLNLKNLEKKGYISRSKAKTRHIEVLETNFYTPEKEIAQVPIIGEVTAGEPILAESNIEGYFPVPVEYLKNNETFMLRIKGDSMIGAGIFNKDLVIINKQSFAANGDIVIALIEDTATCKRFFVEDGYVRLQPENDAFEPIILNDVYILGKVIGLFRSF